MSYLLRRLPLSRLLLLCGLVVVIGISVTALAFALGMGPTPPPKPLPEAIHDALVAAPVEGVSANVQLTDHLLEGASLTGGGDGSAGGQLASSPLVTGGSGRMWVSKDGRVRLELQSEKGDTQVLYDGHTVSIYDASSNTLYRYTVPAPEADASPGARKGGILLYKGHNTASLDRAIAKTHRRIDELGLAQPEIQRTRGDGYVAVAPNDAAEVPSVAKIEEAIAHLTHVDVSGATPTDVAGQAAYTVRVSPKEQGSLIGGGELSWDAANGVPLRAALYSSTSSSPTIELAATSISYGPVAASVFEFTPPSNAKVEEIMLPKKDGSNPGDSSTHNGDHPHVTTSGQGITSVAVVEAKATEGAKQSSPATEDGLQKVKINGIEASELPTALGTLLSFERSGVRYFLAGAVSPAAVEAVAKGL